MSHNVTANVVAIITCFRNGLDVLNRTQDGGNKKRAAGKRVGPDMTTSLVKSLRQGPDDINREYRRGLREFGDRYAFGDALAENALAEILLRMNTALIGIMTSCMNDKTKKQKPSTMNYPNLVQLSEVSRQDSVRALRRLHQRMLSMNQSSSTHTSLPQQMPAQRATARQKSTPRIKSPTIAHVTIENSSKKAQLAIVKPAAKRPSSSSTSNLSKARSSSLSSSTTLVNPTRSGSSQSVHKPRQASKSSPNLIPLAEDATKRAQPCDGSQALTRPRPARSGSSSEVIKRQPPCSAGGHPQQRSNAQRRQVTPTIYSIATDSTKLGEIPLHKWAVPYDFDAMSLKNREAMRTGWPVMDSQGNVLAKPRRRFALFRIFHKAQ